MINNNNNGQEETFGGNGYVNGIDCGDAFTNVYLSPKSYICTLNIYSFVYVSHTSMKWFFKNMEQPKISILKYLGEKNVKLFI